MCVVIPERKVYLWWVGGLVMMNGACGGLVDRPLSEKWSIRNSRWGILLPIADGRTLEPTSRDG